MNAYIAGTGRFLPPDILTNDDLSRMVDTNDEWIVSHTGIRQRHIARAMSNTDMAERAARAAMENAGCTACDIDMVIVATVTPDNLFPSTACDVQHRLGLENAFCMDVGAACSGFIYAADMAARYLTTGGARTALVIATEKLSPIIDFTDRSTCILFGDGAGAVVMKAGEAPGGWLGSYLASRGDGGAALTSAPDRMLHMDGHEVFKFAVRAMPEAIDKTLALTGHTPEELSVVIPHQANIRIIDAVMRRHGFPPEKIPVTLDKYGNTSSSSIPIALDELNRGGKLKPGDLVMLVGFGAGLTYGATLFEWKSAASPA